MRLTEAIARMEGFNVPGSRAARNSNPGNIEWGAFAQANGADRIETVGPHQKARFAHFPSSQVGFDALKALLLKHYKGLTVQQMMQKYAPPCENNTTNYTKNLCEWTGLMPGTVIDEYL